MHEEGFTSLNLKGAVPTLVHEDVAPYPLVLTEFFAVLLYIAAQARGARLGATDGDRIEQARLNEIMNELVSDVHNATTPSFSNMVSHHALWLGRSTRTEGRKIASGLTLSGCRPDC